VDIQVGDQADCREAVDILVGVHADCRQADILVGKQAECKKAVHKIEDLKKKVMLIKF